MLTVDREVTQSVEAERRMLKMVELAGPALLASRAQSESARRLAPQAAQALLEGGVLRSLLPAEYGGADLGPVYGIQLFEELARIDASAAWVGAISAAGGWLLGLLPPQGTGEILDDPRAVINGSLFPPVVAERAAGGYRVSGRSSFASGCDHATWIQCQAVLMEEGAPIIGPNGMPAAVLIHVPAPEFEVIDTWHTLGMRGTGSNDYQIRDAFVPEHRAWQMGPVMPVNPAFRDGLNRMGVWWFSPLLAAVALGTARAAVDELRELARYKVPSYVHGRLADKSVVQDKLARARAVVQSARAYLYQSLADAEQFVLTEPRLTIEQGIPLALSASHAVESACTAVDLVHSCAGTSAVRTESRFQQYFRDVHTISQHAFLSAARFESIGKLLLDRESDWPFYYL